MNLEKKYLSQLCNILKNTLGNTRCEVLLFGSRATKKNSITSDIDLAVKTQESVDYFISNIKEHLEESCIPYHFDIVEYYKVNEIMRKNIDKEGIIIWKN